MKAKMQHCVYCGKELGVYAKPSQDQDTCGARECERYVADCQATERDEAHEQLDRVLGYF